MEVLTSNENEFLCPNFNCNTKTLTSQEFIKHTIVCPTCLVCSDCNQTFNLYETYKGHECLVSYFGCYFVSCMLYLSVK